jgi:hypothetical protein
VDGTVCRSGWRAFPAHASSIGTSSDKHTKLSINSDHQMGFLPFTDIPLTGAET